jgi:hypothetical protein
MQQMGSFERYLPLIAAAPKSKLNGSEKVWTPDCAHIRESPPRDFKCKIQQADAAEMHSV